MSHRIEFRDVHRHFGKHAVLSGLSFAVRPGEIYSLLGRNGTGKTTAINILLGFLRPVSGSTSILGVDSLKLGASERLRIGLVTEGHQMYRWMSVREALAFEEGTRSNFRRSFADHAVARLGLRLSQQIGKLSRGQRAQLSLVFALSGKPEVLVMDDPAMGLDAVLRREFLEAMIDLLGGEGHSVLFSSHILSDVERVADRIGILQGGRLIVDATLDDLKTRVERRFARLPSGIEIAGNGTPGVLSARTTREGAELLLVDWDAERERLLSERGIRLGEPVAATLEDVFIGLTGAGAEVSLTGKSGVSK